jgi:hypothetical protein
MPVYDGGPEHLADYKAWQSEIAERAAWINIAKVLNFISSHMLTLHAN